MTTYKGDEMKIQVLVITLFILLLSQFAFAQNLNGVQLNDGTLIYGDVYEKSQNSKWINIKKKDGSSETIRRDDVLKFLNNEAGSYLNRKPTLADKKITNSSFTLKGGVYEATGDLEDVFDTGVYGEIAYNKYLSSNFAIEYSIGYIHTDYNEVGSIGGISYSGSIDIYAIPVAINLKGIIPFEMGELYAGAGIGAYFIQGDLDVTVPGYGSISLDDNDVIIGAQLLTGVSFDLTDTTFLGIEGKFIFTDDATLGQAQLGSVDFNINGYSIMAVLGFRF